MTDLPVLGFGRHKGLRLDEVPGDYLRWLADPKRDEPSPPRPGRRAGGHRPLPRDIVEAARALIAPLEEKERLARLARSLMGGATHEGPDPIFVIETDSDCHSLTGRYVLDHTLHATLDAALAAIAAEHPLAPEDADEAEFHGRTPSATLVRRAPDPEDGRIVVWEVLPSGHRRAVWGFFGWHHSADDFACGQGTLPGDDADLYSLAMRDC